MLFVSTYQRSEDMLSFIRALGKAVSHLIGPMGAPIEFIISLYDDKKSNEMQQLFLMGLDNIAAQQEELKSLVLTPIEGMAKTQVDIVLSAIHRQIAENEEYRQKIRLTLDNASATDEELRDAFVFGISPVDLRSVGLLSEEQLEEDLRKLYQADIITFVNDLKRCGFPVEELNILQSAANVYRAFVDYSRRPDPCINADIFRKLYDKNKASDELGQWAEFYEVLCRQRIFNKDGGPRV
jgi:hypothetical protein